jgi:hypothetical protein
MALGELTETEGSGLSLLLQPKSKHSIKSPMALGEPTETEGSGLSLLAQKKITGASWCC